MQEELVFTIISMLSQSDQIHGYHTQRLFIALSNDISQVNTHTHTHTHTHTQ